MIKSPQRPNRFIRNVFEAGIVLVIREFRFREVSAMNQNRRIFIDMRILLAGLVAAGSTAFSQ
jgi:hypothetical protein